MRPEGPGGGRDECPGHKLAQTAILPIRQYSATLENVSGLRERKRRETRAALSGATIRLCMQHGWENVTVDEIAAAANVSPRTFRNYFSTKAEAVAAGHLERMLRIADELSTRPAGEPLWTGIVQAVTAQFEAPEQRPSAETKRWMQRIQFLFTEPAIHGEVLKASAAAQAELAKVIVKRTARRANDVYPEVAAAVVTAVVSVVLERWLRGGACGPIAPLMRQAFELVTAGLPQEKTRTGRPKP